ncbi:LVIVD repeat-containing protein [Polynucleobacter kasalickyi]|uniref:Uncharacterized conserved protein n=1 Tax=Polynucleobacter kasalickyi TaxID=1938817 RepID=A0A1W2A1W8_9BURK|nr:hypothetical protein [Polynucleobacter kasalickyi]SMC54442.1 Uncharacterized conserved protein [Polynucleobacter kasalickyi]
MQSPNPLGKSDQTLSRNMTLLAHHELNGFGGLGEGISLQITNDGRRILWVAHESAPKNFSGIEVTDPKNPKLIVQTDLPHMQVRSNSLDVFGNILAVAYQTQVVGLKPAGVDLFDISNPEEPKLLSHFDCSGPHSRGVHALWFVDGKYIHMSSGSEDFEPTHPLDDQFYRILDVSDPTQPFEAGRWWYPGTRKGDSSPPPPRMPKLDTGYRVHNTNVFPREPNRAYVGYIDGGAFVLDISDMKNIKVISHWNHSPPLNGFIHTVLPLFDRGLWIVSDECVMDDGADWPKLVWVVDARNEENPVSIGTFPMPNPEVFTKRGGRFGAHNLHENLPIPGSFYSDTIIIGTFFNGGVRVFDTTNPYRVEEIAYYVPGAPKMSPAGAIQINDVFVDENAIVYAIDRFGGGVYILEMNI